MNLLRSTPRISCKYYTYTAGTRSSIIIDSTISPIRSYSISFIVLRVRVTIVRLPILPHPPNKPTISNHSDWKFFKRLATSCWCLFISFFFAFYQREGVMKNTLKNQAIFFNPSNDRKIYVIISSWISLSLHLYVTSVHLTSIMMTVMFLLSPN